MHDTPLNTPLSYHETSPTIATQPFATGTPVFDTRGHLLGAIRLYNPQGSYFVVALDDQIAHDVYVPLDALRTMEPDGSLFLRYSRDDLRDPRWSSPPALGIMSNDFLDTFTLDLASLDWE